MRTMMLAQISIISLLIGNIFAFDYSYLDANKSAFSEQARKQFGYLLEQNTSRKQAVLNQQEQIASKQKPQDPFVNHALKSILPKGYNDIIDSIYKDKEGINKKVPTLFYFFTSPMPQSSLESFAVMSKKLQNKHPELKYYAVLRGFPKEGLKSFMSKYQANKTEGLILRIHPPLYKKLDIKSVPAYAFGMCPQQFSIAGDCDFMYLVKGDVGLDGFFGLIGDTSQYYKQWYFELIEAR